MRNYIHLIFIIFLGCENYLLPKQSGYLRLDYPSAEYTSFGVDEPELPFFFDTNNKLSNISDININSEAIDFIIKYNALDAQINFQYKVKQEYLSEYHQYEHKYNPIHMPTGQELLQHLL